MYSVPILSFSLAAKWLTVLNQSFSDGFSVIKVYCNLSIQKQMNGHYLTHGRIAVLFENKLPVKNSFSEVVDCENVKLKIGVKCLGNFRLKSWNLGPQFEQNCNSVQHRLNTKKFRTFRKSVEAYLKHEKNRLFSKATIQDNLLV